MKVDDIKLYTVMLGEFGSGVLFQANIEENTYVLTARHNFEDIPNGKVLKITFNTYAGNAWGSEVVDFTREDEVNYFAHPNPDCDAAIVKLPYRAGYDHIIAQFGFDNQLEYNLCGYPQDKTKLGEAHEFAFKAHSIESFKDSKDFLQAAITRKNQNQGNLVGISGGGIFGLTEDCLVLLGIQSEIARSVNPEGEFDYVPIHFFNEIIQQAPDNAHLDFLLPSYMKNFLSLSSSIMELQECFDQGFRATVRKLMDEKISGIAHSPKEILASSIKDKMLMANVSDRAYQSRVLWSSWLEYLLVLTVAGQQLPDIGALEELFKSFRLIHSDTEEHWQTIIQDILETDYSEQQDGAVILVSTKLRPSSRFYIDGGMLGNITEVANIGMDIAQAKQVSKVGKFIHIKAFETECIEKKEDELSKFKGMKVGELLEAIKTKFNELLSN